MFMVSQERKHFLNAQCSHSIAFQSQISHITTNGDVNIAFGDQASTQEQNNTFWSLWKHLVLQVSEIDSFAPITVITSHWRKKEDEGT